MFRNKKKIFVAALAVCIVATLSFSTLAWFNTTQSVTNRFLVASSSTGGGGGGGFHPSRKFSVTLWEYTGHSPLPAQGEIPESDKDTDGITFEKVLPGVPENKHPVIENTGEQDQWIRALVTISGADVWKQALPVGYDMGTFFDIGSDWTAGGVQEDAAQNTITYYYYLNQKLIPGDRATLFTQVTLPGEELTQQELQALNGTFDITLRADAIQFSGTGDNAKAVFETVVNWPASSVTPSA